MLERGPRGRGSEGGGGDRRHRQQPPGRLPGEAGGLFVAALLGAALGAWGLHRFHSQKHTLPGSRGLRQLPHHAAAVRRVAEGEPPHGRDVRRLPPAARLLRASTSAKASNGWRHSKAFTLQDFPEPIRDHARERRDPAGRTACAATGTWSTSSSPGRAPSATRSDACTATPASATASAPASAGRCATTSAPMERRPSR